MEDKMYPSNNIGSLKGAKKSTKRNTKWLEVRDNQLTTDKGSASKSYPMPSTQQ